MLTDFKYIAQWWFNIFVIGGVTLPVTTLIFKKFFDRGYVFSKILGILLLSYLAFVSGVAKVIPFTQTSLYGLITAFLALDIFFISRGDNFKKFQVLIKKHLPIFILEEVLFFTVLVFWSYIRGYAPDIEGLEKYMDWGFVNTILRTRFFPPTDMWFALEPINYYYFGHLVFALLTKISNISSSITYNLSIASLAAFAFVSSFSLTGNIVKALASKTTQLKQIIIAGIFSALLLTFGGNLHSIYKIAKINIQNNGHLVLTKQAIEKAAGQYWYPDATRFIGFDPDVNDKTIHEFPVYSFVVSDLHGHVNDVPVVILFMALLFSLAITFKQFSFKTALLLGWVLSIAFMTNAWDFAVYGLLMAVFTLLVNLKRELSFKSVFSTISHGLLVILFWYLFTLPFSLNFIPMAEGLKLSDVRTPFYQLFILYGGFWLIVLPFVLLFLIRLFRSGFSKIKLSDIFAFSLILTGVMLVIIPEIGYIKDIYIYEHRRANTMFKLVYQAFMMFSLASGYVLIRLNGVLKNSLFRLVYKLLFLLIVTIHLVYPFLATKSYYGLKEYKGLWGLSYLQKQYPDNLAAINWLNRNVEGQPNIVEAPGDSYTTFNQFSVATGLPTIEGWLVHEWLWRGGYEKPSARSEEVKKVYESKDSKEILGILQKYDVRYIIVGSKELEKFPNLNTENFQNIGGQIVFESGKTKIFKLPEF